MARFVTLAVLVLLELVTLTDLLLLALKFEHLLDLFLLDND